MLFLLSLVGEGGTGFPICKTEKQFTKKIILIWIPITLKDHIGELNYDHVFTVYCLWLTFVCVFIVIVQSTHCKRSAIDGLSQPCMKHSRAKSSHHISFITSRAQHQGCLHYVSVRGDERDHLRNSSSDSRSSQCHRARRETAYQKKSNTESGRAVHLLRTNYISS